MIKNKLRPLVIRIVVFVIIILLAALLIRLLAKAFKTPDYFKIQDIIVKGQDKEAFSYLVGVDIFSIDLKKESSYILGLYPGYKKVRLIKIFPNRLFIDFSRRIPVACVLLYRNFNVDEDGVLFEMDPVLQGSGFPVIAGLETKIFGAKSGTRYNIKELTHALSIIKEVNANKALTNYKIKKIDVKNILDTSCIFSFMQKRPGGFGVLKTATAPEFAILEVKIGQDNVRERLRMLSGLLARFTVELNNIKYIDLRFKDPIIKFKDAAK